MGPFPADFFEAAAAQSEVAAPGDSVEEFLKQPIARIGFCGRALYGGDSPRRHPIGSGALSRRRGEPVPH
jgi:hypothetical protein